MKKGYPATRNHVIDVVVVGEREGAYRSCKGPRLAMVGKRAGA